MRIAVVGAGIAGLTAAWLLDETADVTVYEEWAEPGGHADSVDVQAEARDGSGRRAVRVDLGAQHLPPTDTPTHTALRAQLGITEENVVRSPLHMTVLAPDGPQPLLVSPHAGPDAANGRTAVTGEAWQVLGRFLGEAVAFEQGDGEWATTLGEFTSSRGIPEPWAGGYVHPWLASFVGCSAADAADMSARAAIAWVTRTAPLTPDSAPVFHGLTRGMQHLAETLAAGLNRKVRTQTPVSRIEVGGDGAVTLHAQGGVAEQYDKVVVAVPAHGAVRLLDGVRGFERQCTALAAFCHVPAMVTIHRDAAYMAEDRAHWSTNTTEFHDGWAETSTWYGPILGVDVFKSWTTHRQPPRDVIAVRSFQHLMVTPAAVRARAQLLTSTASTPVDFAGSYLTDVDSQESAVRTGAEAARRCAPQAERSALLLAAG